MKSAREHDLGYYIQRNFIVCTRHLGLSGSEMCVIMSWTCNAMQNDGGGDAYRILVRNIDIWKTRKEVAR